MALTLALDPEAYLQNSTRDESLTSFSIWTPCMLFQAGHTLCVCLIAGRVPPYCDHERGRGWCKHSYVCWMRTSTCSQKRCRDLSVVCLAWMCHVTGAQTSHSPPQCANSYLPYQPEQHSTPSNPASPSLQPLVPLPRLSFRLQLALIQSSCCGARYWKVSATAKARTASGESPHGTK